MSRRGPCVVGLGVALLSFAACAGPTTPRVDTRGASAASAERPAYDTYDLAQRIHTRTNVAREEVGMPAIGYDDALARVAEAHSVDMARANYFSHTGTGGTSPTDRAAALGYTCSQQVDDIVLEGVSENLFTTSLWERYEVEGGSRERRYFWSNSDEIAEETVQSWLESPGHRTNLLKPTHRVEGLGLAFTDDHRVYVTQLFC